MHLKPPTCNKPCKLSKYPMKVMASMKPSDSSKKWNEELSTIKFVPWSILPFCKNSPIKSMPRQLQKSTEKTLSKSHPLPSSILPFSTKWWLWNWFRPSMVKNLWSWYKNKCWKEKEWSGWEIHHTMKFIRYSFRRNYCKELMTWMADGRKWEEIKIAKYITRENNRKYEKYTQWSPAIL